jgi:molybdopterin-guanine dinucleotide biosynthesis protein A
VRPDVYGAVLAGGRSTRYGSSKALAEVGGRRIVDRALDALRAAAPDIIVLANDPALGGEIGLPFRADARPGLGALGGIHAGLTWAAEDGRYGVLAVACDMPFLSPSLLRLLVDEANDHDVVVPESGGRRGIEPLCAVYATTCLPAIEEALARDDSRMIAFHDEVRVRRVSRALVERHGDPEVLFMNVNTPADHARAEHIARGAA